MKRAAIIISAIFGAVGVLVLAAFIYYFGVTAGVRLDATRLSEDKAQVCVYDKDGEKIDLPALKQTASFSALPDYLPNAFVAVEDKRLYSHRGFDYRRIVKAAMKNITSFSFREGASTLSQQLIKNTHLSGEKTIKRKLKEMKLTRILEKNYSKNEILSLYLNSIYFGHSAFGVEEAAAYYFGKSAEVLDAAESAMLAALVKSPNNYSPFRAPEKCLKRRNFVLSLMRDQGFLDDSSYQAAIKKSLPEAPSETNECGKSYLSRVFEEVSEIYPYEKALGNLKIYTYFDRNLQTRLENVKANSDFSSIVLDNRTHGVKACYSTIGSNIKRLPASLMKPLAVYAPALEENVVTPATPVLDEKTDFGGYSPNNYGGKFSGYVNVRYALAHSVNIPAVKILNILGVERATKYLQKMNLPLSKDDCSLALALGGMREGYTLSALADAYATFANQGNFSPARTIRRIETKDGKTLFEHKASIKQVFSEDVAFLITDMLKSAVNEGTAKKLRSLPFDIAAKTGTGANAAGNTDAYTVSYTTEDTVAVWLGNRDNSPVETTGGKLPAGIALEINRYLYQAHEPATFPVSEGVEKIAFDKEEYETNHALLRADPAAPPITELTEYFRKSAPPMAQSTRFSIPTIKKPSIFVKNGSVCIELCQTEYYDYIIKRNNNGKSVIIYEGKYQKTIYDNTVVDGQTYEYSVTPVYQGRAGEPVPLPSVHIQTQKTPPADWWND